MTRWTQWLVLFVSVAAAAAAEPPARPVDFARHVLPLLRRTCFDCHGAHKQEGGLRLDRREDALRGGDSGPVIVVGQSARSELVARISLDKRAEGVMPARGETLTVSQVNILRKWIDAGTPWPDDAATAKHWAYIPPLQSVPPGISDRAWPRTPIDSFIHARLDEEGLAPSPPAASATLVRRVYLDLLGLPPSPEEADEFLNDSAPDAYQRLVDRLLASPQFGVRWARPWLDYARYADSHGFQRDDFRDVWPYRDWVVGALNSDMPFDQFSIEQLAGDLLPDGDESSKIASGFNRNAPTNVEAGSDPEETRVNQVFDRVATLGMVWLGTTLECCQCHDHKYDPFTMKDYYGLFTFFNQTEIEAERSNPQVPGSIRFLGPELSLHDPALERDRSERRSAIDQLQAQAAAIKKEASQPDVNWESTIRSQAAEGAREHPLDVVAFDSSGGATFEVLADKSVLLGDEAPDRDTYTITVKTALTGIRAFKLETLTHPSLPGSGPGRGDAQRPNFVLNTFGVNVAPESGGDSRSVAFSRATADFSQPRFDVAGAIDQDPTTAWAINPKFRESHWAVFEAAQPVGNGEHLVLTFRLEQNFGGARTIGRLRLSAITGNVGGAALPAELIAALDVPADQRTDPQREVIAEFRLRGDEAYQRLQKEKTRLEAELNKLTPRTTLVMRELDQPRRSTMFRRGDFRNPGEAVAAATPAVLHPFISSPLAPSDGERGRGEGFITPPPRPTRLDLARWLVHRDNPLTARVVVNRWWGEMFGHGLVTTPEDFGIRGELPTHPELLDWLATEYVRREWSLKRLLREIVLSATYRQSSRVTPELLARDDRNLLYTRGPRTRLDAESIRDNALAIGGLLSLNQGGPSIRPYQPDGIWIKVGGQRYEYVVSPGELQYRRGLYVVWKRGAPYPSFMNFDANNRLTCRLQRPRSNTPLQALTLMNDPVYVESAKAFARRVLDETPGASRPSRLERAFRTALVRQPKPNELESLHRLFEAQLEASQRAPETSKQFVGPFELPAGLSVEELVAWYAVAAALLNLDETITKG